MHIRFVICTLSALAVSMFIAAQQPVSVGSGSYASYVPLAESRSSLHGGCQAYQMEHRRLYLPDSLSAKLGSADGSKQGTLALPSNDWWTYALVNQWTGKIWFYPGWAEAKNGELQIGYPTYWEPTGCEVKWDTPLSVTFTNTATGKTAAFEETLVDAWSDFHMSFIMQDGDAWVRVTCMHGSPLVWIETNGITAKVTNPDAAKYGVFSQAGVTTVALLTEGLTKETVEPYAFRIPRATRMDYAVDMNKAQLTTTFRVYTDKGQENVLMGFLPHQYYSEANCMEGKGGNTYMTPRGQMRLTSGNDFDFTYRVHSMLPFFPAPMEWAEGFSETRMNELNTDYAKRGTFGADTYWGGKGLTQMMHYMTFALQMGDTVTFRMAKQRLRQTLENWYTYTPGEGDFYFARYPRWGALVGFDTSYDSDTFNDHHFHYGYFVYASAVLCLLDEDFKVRYGAMAREVARDYANWQRSADEPWFRTLDPYCGHSFAGGMGNEGNGNGQESTSEAIQGWGGVWMLGAALQDQAMLEAGIMGYTLETRATAEYWFDRKRRNIDYTKYNHPYCCNLTMQGVGWWTWFSGDPVWMHSIQWLPISPVLTNYLSEDLAFTRWDYTQMYATKEVGNYEAETGGLGDESGLGNVCLSYLALFEADSAARVWDKMDKKGKPLAKNPDTGGITYWLAHSHRSLGEKRYDVYADHPLACAYLDTLNRRVTYAVYNVASIPLSVHFFGAVDTTITVPHGLTLVSGDKQQTVTTIDDTQREVEKDPLAWELPYPNLALHKPVSVSSFENAGCVAANLTDGDAGSRWGSEHRDGEWALVDLGEMCYIDHLVLRWEAAYASQYELALSDDKSIWRTLNLSSAGGVEQVALADLFGGEGQPSRGRYIRLTGVERATAYGTSLYELEAYGRPVSGQAGTLFALVVSATETVVEQGQTTLLSAQGYDALGNTVEADIRLAVTQGTATLTGNRLLCTDYGTVEVTATAGSVSARLTITVLETEQVADAIVSPEEVTMPTGAEQVFTTYIVNQFGEASDSCISLFRATQVGDTTLTFDCFGYETSATAHVMAFGDVNLALGKPAAASGAEGDATAARFAVDGDFDTRWSSRFQDDEWVKVDLQNCYLLTTVKLYWEAAYATAFDIQLSSDGEEFTAVKEVKNAQGGAQEWDIREANGDPVEARYVRIFCRSRSTGYGSSLYEIEVYGEGLCPNKETGIEIIDVQSQTSTIKFIKDGQLYILHDGTVYSISGVVFKRTEKY